MNIVSAAGFVFVFRGCKEPDTRRINIIKTDTHKHV